jgi:hypothetical protein
MPLYLLWLLAAAFPSAALANIAPTPIANFIAFKPLKHMALTEPAKTPAKPPEQAAKPTPPADAHLTPIEPANPAAQASAQKQFMKLDRKLLVPLRTRYTPVAAPLMNRLRPNAQPTISASSAPTPSLPSSVPTSATLDLFDRKSAPLPSPGNFYKALRGAQ